MLLLVPPMPTTNEKRRGVILLVVMSLLVLFSAVGISFVFYAEAESMASKTQREAGAIGSLAKMHADPEKLLGHFLNQLIYDTTDVTSALRGHSLARNMYGLRTRSGVVTNAGNGANGWIRITSADHGLQMDDIVTISSVGGVPRASGAFPISFVDKDRFDLKNSSAQGTFNPPPPGGTGTLGTWVSLNRTDFNTMPYNGAGRINVAPAGFGAMDKYLLNYTFFPADGLVRNPEFFTNNALAAPSYFASNVSWTYPDLDNFYLGAMNTKGEIITPSFYRTWLPGIVPAGSAHYGDLRPSQVMHPLFPAVGAGGGDVKNVDNATGVLTGGNNDSRWMYTGHPILTDPDGRKYTVLYAPFIMDLDGKVNVNVHGNARAGGAVPVNASHQGFGPWEVSLAPVLPGTYKNVLAARYGKDGLPGAAGNSIGGPMAATPFYSGFDLDGVRAPNLASQRYLLPGEAIPVSNATKATPIVITTGVNHARITGDAVYIEGVLGNTNANGTFAVTVTGPNTFSLNGTTGNANYLGGGLVLSKLTDRFFAYPAPSSTTYGNGVGELAGHPALFNPFNPKYTFNNKTADDRTFGPSNLDALLRHGSAGSPSSLSELYGLSFLDFPNNRLKLTTMSFDMGRPGAGPWLDASAAYATGVKPYPIGPTYATPASPIGGEYMGDGRSAVGRLSRLSLNQPMPAYPLPSPPTVLPAPPNPEAGRIPQTQMGLFRAAQAARQVFAKQLFDRLRLATTGIPPEVLVTPTPATKWLAQLAANIVDFMDADDYYTPFNFNSRLVSITSASTDTKPAPLTPIIITSASHGLTTGTQVAIAGVLGNTAANGVWTITMIDVDRFSLNGSVANLQPAYLGGGLCLAVLDLAPSPANWVYGVESPKLLLNEAYAEMRNDPADTFLPGNTATMNFKVNMWIELFNPLRDDPNMIDVMAKPAVPGPDERAGAVRLVNPSVPNYPTDEAVYKIQVVKSGTVPADSHIDPPAVFPGSEVSDYTPEYPTKVGVDVKYVRPNQRVEPPIPPVRTTFYSGPIQENKGFFVLGPKDKSPDGAGTDIATICLKNGLTWPVNYKTTPEATRMTDNAPTILLRRLACPHLPYDNTPGSLTYNPYVTVDTFDLAGKVVDAVKYLDTGLKAPAPVTLDKRYSYGRPQPFAAHSQLLVPQTPDSNTATVPAPIDPLPGEPQHTFFRHNGIDPAAFPPINDPYAGAQTLAKWFDWLPHFDRPLASPMELLHVPVCKPHELTFNFMKPNQRFGHTHAAAKDALDTPKLNTAGQPIPLWFESDTRLYRFFELVDCGYRGQGVTADGRIPGKININTAIWKNDPVDVLAALADYQPGVSTYAPNYLGTLLDSIRNSRSPGGIPGATDKPFKSLATGWAGPADAFPTNGVDDTLLRGAPISGSPTVLQVPPQTPTPVTDNPVHKYELLSKIFNNVTTRSNVFAVWLTAGFFEVTDGAITNIKTGGVKAAGPPGQYDITPVAQPMTGSINGNQWQISAGMHVWIADPKGTILQHAKVLQTTATDFRVALSTKPNDGDVIGVKCVLGPEVGAAENKNIRHRMFAVIDRSNLVMPDVKITSATAVVAGANKTITVSAVNGTATLSTGVPVTMKWSVAIGSKLVIDQGLPTEEIITIKGVKLGPQIDADFLFPHAAGAVLRPVGRLMDPLSGGVYGNPGPQPNFDVRKQSAVVPYFSVIQ